MMPLITTPFQAQVAHSVLNPASPQTRRVEALWDAMYLASIVVFILVTGALLWAAFRRRAADAADTPARTRSMHRAVLLATVLTTATLLAFLVADIATGRANTSNPGPGAVQIQVTGHQWWWEVRYRDSIPQNWVTTANEIHVPVGHPVVVELRSTDVIHSFWPPNLSVKRDLIPGNANSVWFQAESAGVYRGQCAEYCGLQHAKMGFQVIAQAPQEFGRWLSRQRDTALTPSDSITRRGQEVFLGSSCVMCHAVSGTPAGSHVGPDLTHLASRRTIAAGTLPNTRGNLAGWILDPQSIKPGVRMPATRLDPKDLQALLSYLESLK